MPTRERGIVTLGRVDRPFLIDLLKSADVFVQPGRPGPFNDYRLPSKLPEFMAVGRPIILPATNVGLRLRPGVEAMLLTERIGGGDRPADRVNRRRPRACKPPFSERTRVRGTPLRHR